MFFYKIILNLKTFLSYFLSIVSEFKIKFIILFFLIFIAVLLESLSIGIFLPIIMSLTNSEKIKPFLSFFFLDKYSYSELLYIFCILLGLIFIAKSFFLIFFNNYKVKFSILITSFLSNKLLRTYLKQDYIFFKSKGTSYLHSRINEVFQFGTFSIILINLFVDFLLLFIIFIILLYFYLINTILIFFALFFFLYIYIYIVSGKFSNHSKDRFSKSVLRHKNISNILNSIRDIKINNLNNFYLKLFNKFNSDFLKITHKEDLYNPLPKLFLELMLILSFCLFIIFSIFLGVDNNNLLTSLGIVALISYKLLPTTQKLIYNFIYFKNKSDLIKNLYLITELDSKKEYKKKHLKKITLEKKIIMSNLSFSYPTHKKRIIDNLNIEIKKNSLVGIYGKSGIGKSTFVDLLSGLLKPSAGNILIDNSKKDIFFNLDLWKDNIGYVAQNIFLFDDTLINNITFGIKNINHSALKRAIKYSDLSDAISKFPNGANTIIGENGFILSAGQRQRVGIARALYKKPKILILDESTSNLDINSEEKIFKSLKKLSKKTTIIIISHRLESLKKYCDETLLFSDQRLLKKSL
jgi:ABC-type bacteriocin/lantibiotic exporter with double-glycine peptidase domain